MMSDFCLTCGSAPVERKNMPSRTGVDLEVFFCGNCGHGFQVLSDDYDIYSSGEFSIEARDSAVLPTPAKIKALDKKAYKRFGFYKQYFNDAKTALEVGSSIGSFVHLLKLSGIEAKGIEPDPSYASFSTSQYGFDQEALLFENYHPQEQFDLVYSFHVIEHVPDPEAYVKKAHELINPNGKLIIECPSWDLHCFGDEKFTMWAPHLQYFTLSSMYALLAKNKFEVQEVNFIGSALFAIAVKSEEVTFSESRFKHFKRRFKRTFQLNKYLPTTPFSIKDTSIKSLTLQYLLSKNNRSYNELFRLAKFSISNKRYLRKEAKNKNKRACHVSYYSGWENAGDTVLSACVRKTMNTRMNNGWDLLKLTDAVSQNTIDRINRSEYLVIGGGGVLLPDSNPNSISGWQWAIDPSYWQEIKVPIIVYAIGYNYFKGQENSELFIQNLHELVKRADFFSLRNHGSIRKVKEILSEELHEKIHFQPCPTTIIRKLYPEFPSKIKSEIVGVNIAYDRYERRFGKDIYQILDQIAIALKELEKMGYQILNICHLENDTKFEISLDRRGVNYKTINMQFMLPDEVHRVYNGIEIMLGARGHAQMIPFGVNTKILSLGTHEKLAYFLEDIDALDWYIDVRDSPGTLAQTILDKVDNITGENLEHTELKIANQQERLFQITNSNLSIIEDILKQYNTNKK